ncbi:creatininase family protein [Clostridium sediminicola]|uniref:creatininase family protein n=1 Tax=Clostridium sediminicola TaxID=3114879 RepID=UPI0031F26C5C
MTNANNQGRKPSYWWQHKSWQEIVEHAKKCDIAILPIGSVEQHGPHCPTGHDTLQLFPMLEDIAERTGAMLLPVCWYGAHPHHHWGFPGTIPLSNDTLKAVLKDIVRGAEVAGYKKFIFFYGHGQAFVTNYTVQDLGLEGYFVLSVMFQNIVRDVHNEIFETPFWHADEAESSIGLHTFPDYMDMSLAVDESATPVMDPKYVTSPSEYCSSKPMRFDEGTVGAPELDTLKHGVMGKPSLATREKGEKYCNIIVDRMVEMVEDVKKKYPVGVEIKTTAWKK